ncbi:hypothetical protein K493DRAFT_309391 [Basidiobolus meristosporus CBS 931.73]|nr:hypothetical protein K493DRAFT_309391 [Basidiobolus meristosporus CBS 931.73]|eukprot:ORX66683.1 hypothetical protein K493DRAFT_309391 [Basidiobolus meristosporus CBS 931.73]
MGPSGSNPAALADLHIVSEKAKENLDSPLSNKIQQESKKPLGTSLSLSSLQSHETNSPSRYTSTAQRPEPLVAPHTPTTTKRKLEIRQTQEITQNYGETKRLRAISEDPPGTIEVLVEKKSQKHLDTFAVDFDRSLEELSPESYVSSKVAELLRIKRAAKASTLWEREEALTEGSQDDESQSVVYEYFDYSDIENVNLIATSQAIPSNGKDQATTSSNECQGYGKCTKAFCFDCALAEAEDGLP